MLITLFATRSVGAEATTGLAANEHLMAVGESGGESPFDADPRATRPFHWVAVEEAVAKCVSKPRRGEKDAGGSSNSFRGASLRSFQRQSEKFSPRRAAPDGAACEKHPRVRPNLVVAPWGAARRRLGLRYRLSKRLSNSALPRRGACARKVPTRWLNCALPLGAAALALCFAFPQRVPLGFPPPRPIGSCPVRPKSCPCVCHRARVAVCGAFVLP